MKLLTVCIPTYKRQTTLRRCIDSIVLQIEKYALSDYVNVYVANDASPDDTVSILYLYASLSYFNTVTREKNLGMNVNIRCMLNEVAKESHYQLIITDDDYLQPDTLGEIVEFLRQQQNDNKNVPVIWTPRYSYTEDGKLHCVVCNPFKNSFLVRPSAINAGRYMTNGFVLSGLIIQAKYIDYEFWDRYEKNAYFSVIFMGDLLFRNGAYYWNNNIIHHTVLNECHWERWGKNDVLITLRLFSDFVNAYEVMSRRISEHLSTVPFYYASFPSIYSEVNSLQLSDKLRGDRLLILYAIRELKAQGTLKFNVELRLFMVCAWLLSIPILISKLLILCALALFIRDGFKKERYLKRISAYLALRKTMLIVLSVIL